jgi:Kef-type K+ transport system membrane component KefB/Trk K+ transport system NAD-binding subunit
MHDVALDLLILLASIWLVAVTLRPLGLPTVMGELIVGVVLGPAVLGLIEPSAAIQLLAEIGIFFLMFHAGVETQPVEFYDALKRSLGVAIVGAIVPFSVSFGVAWYFGFGLVGATFVGLVMTATAVVITLKSLKDLGLANTRVARIIVASCVIDDLLTLVFFGLILGLLSGGSFDPNSILLTLGKVILFFVVALALGRVVYPKLHLPFRSEGGKGFTFVLLMAIAMGLFAEVIGLHMILGAYVAGLFFEEEVAHPNLVRVVKDRAYGIAYSFLGPIFFISLGFSVTFDISASVIAFIVVLVFAVIVGQILSAGGMALRMGLPFREALTVGVGMCGRAEIAFILAALALSQGAITGAIFSALIFVAFMLNLFTPLALKGCAVLLEGRAAQEADATAGIVQLDTFGEPLLEEDTGRELLRSLPDVEGAVVIYGYGPEVASLLEELDSRGQHVVLIEEDEEIAERLISHGHDVVLASLDDQDFDLRPLATAKAVVANGEDENNALLAVSVRELGFDGTFVALIDSPSRRSPLLLAGANAAFTPSHVLAAAVAARASTKIGPWITGVQPLAHMLELAEIRVHSRSPLMNRTIEEAGIDPAKGVHIVGRWAKDHLEAPPAPDEPVKQGTILVAVGSPEGIQRLSEIVQPITPEGTIVVVGHGDVGRNLVDMLRGVGEPVRVIDENDRPGVDIVSDELDTDALTRAEAASARVVILACDNDSASVLAATVARDFAPSVPIIACAYSVENVARLQKAGADYALALGQVSGQLLAHHILGEMVSQQSRLKLLRVDGNRIKGRLPVAGKIRDRTGCSVIAVEQEGSVIMEIPGDFDLGQRDVLYLCGTAGDFERFHDLYPGT